jgi:hypothetical protein
MSSLLALDPVSPLAPPPSSANDGRTTAFLIDRRENPRRMQGRCRPACVAVGSRVGAADRTHSSKDDITRRLLCLFTFYATAGDSLACSPHGLDLLYGSDNFTSLKRGHYIIDFFRATLVKL